MANLGSLWYQLGIKDMTDADLQRINAKLKNLGFDIQLTPKILKDLTQSAVPRGIKIELDPTIKNEALARAVEGKVMRVQVMPLITQLRKALREATKENPPEMEVGVQSVKLRRTIENVLNRQGFMLNVSTVNDNYSKAIQAKLNGTRYNVKIHADANEITRSVQASLMQVQSRHFGLQVSRDMLYRSIDEALGQKRFNINIAVQHDQARRAVQDALLRAQVIGKDHALAYQRLQTGEMKAAQAELLRLKAAHQEAANAAKAHATASVNLGGAMGSNIKIAGELGSAMTSLYSIHAAKQFLSQVIEIGGELEHQKIAMNTIFGDEGKQMQLSGQIKGLARNSPFGVMELMKSVKALSAYGVQYNEIYETAKRLADISAATSVDINRLILAFGKTKSRGFLDGLEAKQFAYANIPIYEMVRRKLEELEGQAVTTQEVMERMRKREISFGIVKDVLWDMTDPGGKFYDMQEALAGSVKTSWKLVRDNIELMFGEIAESAVGNTLKSTAEILQGLTREWRTVGTVVAAAAVGLGIYRVATIGLNQVMQKGTATAYQNLMAEKQRDAQRLRSLSLVMDLTAAEKARIATANRLTNAELAQALKTEKLTLAQIEQLFVTGKLNKANIMYLFRMGLIDKEGARAILTHNRLAISIKGVGMAMASAGKAIGTFLLNPWTIGIAAVTALVGLWQRHSEKIEETKENIKQLGETAREGSKNLSAEVEKLNAQNPETMVSSEFLNSIEEMKNVLKDYDPTWMDAFKEAFSRDEAGNIKSLAEQYDILKQAVIDTAEAYKYLNQIKDAAYDAQDETDGWFNDSMLENIKDFSEASREYDKIVGKIVARSDMAERAVNMGMSASPAYAVAAANKPLEEQIKLLVEYRDAWNAVFQGFNVRYSLLESWGIGRSEEQKFIADLMDLPSKIQDVNIAINSMQEDEGNFAEGLKSRLEGKWGNMEQWTEPMKKAVIKAVRDVYSKAEGVAKEEADKLANQTLTTVFKFRITTDFELDSQQLNDWQTELDNLTKGQFTTIIRMAPDYLTALSEIQKATDEAQKKLNDAKLKMPIDIQFNGNFSMKPQDIPGWNVLSPSMQNAAMSMLGWTKQIFGAKAGNITPTPPRQSSGNQRTPKDKFAEDLKQRFKDIKDAWSEFQKWSKTEGREAAATRIGESGLFSTLSTDKIPQTVEQYRALVVELENELRKAGVKGTARESLLNDLLKQLLDIDKTVVDEQLKLALDKVSKEAERQLADWNLFDKIRKATGNEELAMSIGFGLNADAETDYPKLIEQQLDKQTKAYETALAKKNKDYTAQGYTYASLKELYDKANAEGTTDADMNAWLAVPDKIREAWEKANGDILKYFDQQREAVANILGEYQTLQDKINGINAKRDRDIAAVNQQHRDEKTGEMVYDIPDGDERKRLEGLINSKADWEIFQKSSDYMSFFNDIYGLTLQKAQQIGDAIQMHLNDQLQRGLITIYEYEQQMEKVRKQLDAMRNIKSDAMTFLTGGVKGLNDKRLAKAQGELTQNPQYKAMLEKQFKLQQEIEEARKNGDEESLKNKQKDLDKLNEELKVFTKIRDAIVKNQEQWQDVLDVVNIAANIAGGISDAFNSIRDMADALGFDTESNAWLNVGGVIDTLTSVTGGISKAVQSAMKGDIGGIISGTFDTLLSPITIWSKLHDKKLQKQIEESQRVYDLLDKQLALIADRLNFALGSSKQITDPQAERDKARYDEAVRRSQRNDSVPGMPSFYGPIYKRIADKLRPRVEAYKEGGVYAYQRQLMAEQIASLTNQRNAEADKKDSDSNAIADYNNQIASLQQQIRDFAESTIETLYGINIRSFAEDIGSALIDAFAKGEDAAEAFDRAVGDIMRDVVKQMAIKNILEKQFEGMRTFLFGADGMSGAFGADFYIDKDEAAALKAYFDEIKDSIPKVKDLFDSVNEATGGLLTDTESKSGLSAGIQSVTEDTADLLASYLNATRADVSEQTHILWPRLLDDVLPQMNIIAQSQLDYQRQIAENTMRNAVAAEAIVVSAKAIAESNDEINRLLARVTQGASKFYVH